MQAEMESVLDLQPGYTSGASDEMQLRGLYVRGDIADFVRDYVAEIAGRLLCDPEDVEVEGKNSTGYNSRVPWVRFADRTLSPDPRTGWYATYLFHEDGDEVSLSLNQGTQEWDGMGLRSRPEDQIVARSDWARAAIAEAIAERPRLNTAIALGTHDKALAYEAGNVVAYRYPKGAVPDDDALRADLLDLADLLQLVYRAEARAPVPGDPSPEITEGERAAQEIAGKRVPARAGFRTNVKQRKAIELRAMKVATEYFEGLGGGVEDVSAKKSFDLAVALHGEDLSVEVKGTAGEGAEVFLTRGEVEHHLTAHPANALAVVSGIQLQGAADAPEAIGGTLRVVQPWAVLEDGLTPVSYRYVVPSADASGGVED